MSNHVAIIGAGQAGLQVALGLRERGHRGPVTLIGNEPHLPYHRPPLSKRGVTELIGPDDLAIRTRGFIEKAGVTLRLDTRVASIDRRAHDLLLGSGERLGYDRLVLATGSVPRRLSLAGAGLPNVVSLKDFADLDRLRGLLVGTSRTVIVGGGFVGLELAGSLTATGISVTVIEAAPRLLARVASVDLSAHMEAAHLARGVAVRTGVSVASIDGDARATAVMLASGETIATDLVIVGIGADADDRLASAAGVRTDRGILVNANGRTSDPDIYAAGDCARFDHPVYGVALRLESVNNALDHARIVAASLTGVAAPAPAIPWFWSDQFDLKIQLAGIPSPLDRVEPVSGEGDFVRQFWRDGALRAIEAVNAPRAFMQARRQLAAQMTNLIEENA